MKIGNILRWLVDKQLPSRASRTVIYNDNEVELQVKFKNELPSAIQVGNLISTTLMEMTEAGYSKFSNTWTSIEAGTKMTITIKAKSYSKGTNHSPIIPDKIEEDETVGSISEKEAAGPCPNCKEPSNTECACLRNKCLDCGGPVGNITFTVCDECWDKSKNNTLTEEPKPESTDKEDKIQSLVLAMEYGYTQCEKGNNLQQAIINFNNTLSGKK